MSLGIYLPVYNGKEFISKNLVYLIEFVKTELPKSVIYVVDDNSNDGTIEIVEELCMQNENLVLIINKIGPSRRENLAKAMNSCLQEYEIYIDSDLPIKLTEITRFYKISIETNSIVIGSRYAGVKVQRNFSRLVASKVYNWLIRFMFKTGINDHTCGFKMFKTEQFKELYKLTGYDNTSLRGWFWDAEMLISAKKKNFKIKEIPVQWIEKKSSTFSYLREIKILKYIFRNFFRIRNFFG